jgi:LmbE family N-acetylglucosaminyl deacetylase
MTTATAVAAMLPPAAPAAGPLPRAGSVLALTARPGQESADLSGVLYAFRRAGASLTLLCLTRGEASSLNSNWCARLEAIRPWELQLAANVLGISSVAVASFPDGALRDHQLAELTERVRHAIGRHSADLVLVISPEAGDSEDAAAASAACAAAESAGIPVMARTEPGAPGAWMIDLAVDAATARAIQKSALAAHQSQSRALLQLIRRLDLLDGRDPLRWLASPARTPGARRGTRPPTGSPSSSDSPAVRPARALKEVTAMTATRRGRRGPVISAPRRVLRALRHVNDELTRASEAIIRSARAPRPRLQAPAPESMPAQPGPATERADRAA